MICSDRTVYSGGVKCFGVTVTLWASDTVISKPYWQTVFDNDAEYRGLEIPPKVSAHASAYHYMFLKESKHPWGDLFNPLLLQLVMMSSSIKKRGKEDEPSAQESIVMAIYAFIPSERETEQETRKVPSRLDEGKSVFVFVAVWSGWDSNRLWWSYCFRVCRVKSKVTCGFRANFGSGHEWGGAQGPEGRKRGLHDNNHSA